jgi:hypothetical protein
MAASVEILTGVGRFFNFLRLYSFFILCFASVFYAAIQAAISPVAMGISLLGKINLPINSL